LGIQSKVSPIAPGATPLIFPLVTEARTVFIHFLQQCQRLYVWLASIQKQCQRGGGGLKDSFIQAIPFSFYDKERVVCNIHNRSSDKKV